MSYSQSRFTLYAIDGLLLAAIFLFTVSAMAAGMVEETCPTTLMHELGKKTVQQIQRKVEEGYRDFQPILQAVPDELAYTANESLPWFRRMDLLTPVRPRAQIVADAYYGSDYLVSSPDVHVLPSDSRIFCLLQPGRGVFLSDGVTHHYAIVYDIDYQRKIVTLVDRWAKVSFLLAGHNVLGVKALPHKERNQLLLDLTFDEFLRVLRGSIETIVPRQMFETLEKLYPEMAATENYLAWKYSRLLASDDFDTSMLITLKLSNRADINAMPQIRTLLQWGYDYTIGIISGFNIPEFWQTNTPSDIPKRREAFLRRLNTYGKILPWPLKWLLLRRTDETEDVELRLLIIDSFLKADPSDNDFQIARAETLLRQGRVNESIAQLDAAETQWTKDVSASIAKTPPAQAVAFLFKKDYGIDFLMVLHWRYQRIHLLRLIAELQRPDHKQIKVEQVLLELMNKYVIGSFLVDFFPQILQIAFLDHQRENEDIFIKTVSEIANKKELNAHFSNAMYEHFTTRRSIKKLSQATLTALRRSPVRRELCILANEGKIIPNMLKPLQDSLASFCGLHVTPQAHKH